MKKILLAILLFSSVLIGQTYTSSYTGAEIDSALQFSLSMTKNVLYVSSTSTKYTTINSALADYQAGDLILLAPETFSEDITLTIEGMQIQGVSKELSIVQSITVTASRAFISNLTVENAFTLNGSGSGVVFDEILKVTDCNFNGDVFLGTTTQSTDHFVHFGQSNFTGENKQLVCNNSGYNYFNDCYFVNDFSDFSSCYDLKLYQGSSRFYQCNQMQFDSLVYVDSGIYAHMEANGSVLLASQLTNLETGGLSKVLAVRESQFYFDGNTDTVTIDGSFELDIERTRIKFPTMEFIFNSTHESRWEHVQQVGYNSSTTISGTGLENIALRFSTFGMSAPGNFMEQVSVVWNVFLDD